MKKRNIFLLIICILFSVSSCSKTRSPSNSVKQKPLNLSQTTATIFIHGSGGSLHDFDTMIGQFPKEIQANLAVLQVSIQTNQQLIYHNTLPKKVQHPLICIEYQNKNDQIDNWGDLLAGLVKDLSKTYQFTSINLVGFSNGGLAASYYVEHYAHRQAFPEVKRLITIGAPFNDLKPLHRDKQFSFEQPDCQTPMLTHFLTEKKHIPKQTAVLSIAGLADYQQQSDTIVPLTSALASRLIFADQCTIYQEKIAEGNDASHVALIQNNPKVASWVVDFLWSPLGENTSTAIPIP